MTDIDALKAALLQQVAAADDLAALEAARIAALGKKGRITAEMKTLGGLDPDTRRATGQALNAVKEAVQAALEAKQAKLEAAALSEKLAGETIDVTLDPRPRPAGSIHPISQTIDEMVAIFADMGFSVAEGPDIEDDFHNFTALNIPEDHPARQMHDTFYLPDPGQPSEPGKVLRTHTSPVQIRHMQAAKPPHRIIAPGRVYRSDYDMTHTPMFHQIEGLVIDRTSHMGDLKGVLLALCEAYFGVRDLPIRFRPSFFPFTEPSAEVDIGAHRAGGELKIGPGAEWMEIGGCGMVHPNVLRACGIDPEEWQGYAFGMGIERMAMLKYGIPDLRTFFEGDIRWLKHYGFLPLARPNLAVGLDG